MSASFGLIKFKKTGNIYYGCYDGTSDIMIPFICTPEECYDEKTDSYWAITHCRWLSDHGTWEFPDDVSDLDDIEIYSDYSGGFYWSGTGSESARMIKDYLNPWEATEVKDGEPDWVTKFLEDQDNEG